MSTHSFTLATTHTPEIYGERCKIVERNDFTHVILQNWDVTKNRVAKI